MVHRNSLATREVLRIIGNALQATTVSMRPLSNDSHVKTAGHTLKIVIVGGVYTT